VCLITFAWQTHPALILKLAANRDEFHLRPSAALARWVDAPSITAGRDLQGSGTFAGMASGGRFAAVTNVRESHASVAQDAPSRGHLVRDFLLSQLDPLAFATSVARDRYAGFNLLVGTREQMVWLSNRSQAQAQVLEPGIYGLSNAGLNTPWPKVKNAISAMRSVCAGASDDELWDMLGNQQIAADPELPTTGVSIAWERQLSASFIHGHDYGTRASTVIDLARNHFIVRERSFGPLGAARGEVVMREEG